jgi:hypothetical protein
VQTQFKNFLQNKYFKGSEVSTPTGAETTAEWKLFQTGQRPRSGKSDFLEENADAVKALAQQMEVKRGNAGGRHRKAGSDLWKSLGEDEQACWQRVAALKAR